MERADTVLAAEGLAMMVLSMDARDSIGGETAPTWRRRSLRRQMVDLNKCMPGVETACRSLPIPISRSPPPVHVQYSGRIVSRDVRDRAGPNEFFGASCPLTLPVCSFHAYPTGARPRASCPE